MAKATEWEQHKMLQALIGRAVEEMEIPEGYEDAPITICIKFDLSEVYASVLPWWEDERLPECMGESTWNIETAPNAEDAPDIADLYFDLR